MRQAEEVERDILLKSLRGSEERSMKAQRLESGALRRMRYVHWAAAQLLCVGPVLPLHEARTRGDIVEIQGRYSGDTGET